MTPRWPQALAALETEPSIETLPRRELTINSDGAALERVTLPENWRETSLEGVTIE
ncbi:hypothetical protein [Natronosalvus amylolyticus]|uniref:hypothetical protein n=1 Tax=Natronosalvus amylolyticus TaxID=2961994 RepID=UPI0020CA079F|nr:hypothetical protein [Natronosalvus amylolyticus]